MDKRVLILGNGFDMDLGLPTSYKGFVESPHWPFKELSRYYGSTYDVIPDTLGDALLLARHKQSWFDIESTLGKYACIKRPIPSGGVYEYSRQETEKRIANDRYQYNTLVTALGSYLAEAQKSPVNRDSVAAKVLRTIISNGYFNHIYTFNYTDLRFLAGQIGIRKDFPFEHMHGSLNSGIILGIESNMDFDKPYRFMCKEYNPHYRTRALIRSLDEAKEVVIFGHSLSQIDYHYFQSFFMNQSMSELSAVTSKIITIFTRDEESQMDICDRLREMNDRHLDFLFGNNHLRLIRTTDVSDTSQLHEYLDHLKETSREAHNRKLSAIL